MPNSQQAPSAPATTSTKQPAPDPTPKPLPAPTQVEVVIIAPGTELALGDKAVVPTVANTRSDEVGLPLTGIGTGAAAELKSWEF